MHRLQFVHNLFIKDVYKGLLLSDLYITFQNIARLFLYKQLVVWYNTEGLKEKDFQPGEPGQDEKEKGDRKT